MSKSGGYRENAGRPSMWVDSNGDTLPSKRRRIPSCVSVEDIQRVLDEKEINGSIGTPSIWPYEQSKPK